MYPHALHCDAFGETLSTTNGFCALTDAKHIPRIRKVTMQSSHPNSRQVKLSQTLCMQTNNCSKSTEDRTTQRSR